MDDARLWQPVIGDPGEFIPRSFILLAASAQRLDPQYAGMVAQGGQGLEIGRDGEVRVEPAHHLPQPLALFRNALVPAPPEFLLDFLELGLRPLAPGLAPQLKPPRRERPQMWVKPRKSKVSGLPAPRLARSAEARRPNSISRVLSA